MDECIICGKELEKYEQDICDSCFRVLTAKYPRTKFQEVIKWHKKNAKKLKE
jgi:predicted nucleic acid-binding Zn ribbon protein